MASPSSPAWGSSPLDMASSPAQLTPRSKIRALMAQVSDDSDDATTPSKAPLKDATSKANRRPQITADAQKDQDPATENDAAQPDAYNRVKTMMINGDAFARPARRAESERSDEDEDEEIVLPRGRMAARLQGGSATTTKTVEEAATTPVLVPREQSTEEGEAKPTSSPQSASTDDTNNAFRRGKFLLRKKQKEAEPTSAEHNSPDSAFQDHLTGDASQPTDSSQEQPSSNSRFLELVARKRQEREAREAEEERLQEEKLARIRANLEDEANQQELAASKKKKKTTKSLQFRKPASPAEGISDAEDADAEAEIDRKLTQQSRPTRKASKKALEEISRETQRISRNMQLAHEARTRKKISTQSLLDLFNFRRTAVASDSKPSVADKPAPNSSAANSSAPTSDVEGAKEDSTPSTSPIGSPASMKKAANEHAAQLVETLQNVQEINRAEAAVIPYAHESPSANATTSKGKDRMAETLTEGAKTGAKTPPKQSVLPRAVKVHAVQAKVHLDGDDNSSDSDLEIVVQGKPAALNVFERVQPASKQGAEGKAMLTLRALAHLESPGKNKSSKNFVNQATLQANLRRQARQQAAKERAEKIQDLRDRGIIVQTEEERERDQAQMEDLLEKARRENEELARREKDAAKREARANGEELPSSEDEDEEYEVDADEDAELELSGSEDEEEDGSRISGDEEAEDDADQDEVHDANNSLILEVAEEGDESAEEADTEESETEQQMPQRHRARQRAVVQDDEDEEEHQNIAEKSPQKAPPSNSAPVNPFLQMGKTSSDSAPLGLTQAFAASMADSQDGLLEEEPESITDMPAPDFAVIGLNSQFVETQVTADNTLNLDLHFSQSQIQEDSQPPATQLGTQADIPDPTQDVGFAMSSPARERFADAPPSTIATVRVDTSSQMHTPTPQKRGRLRRRKQAVAAFSDDEDAAANQSDGDDDFDIRADAFDVMKRAAIKANKQDETFDKKQSKAKPMIEEQAEESEDEYAGLGGASDDDSGGELDEETMRMIEHGEVEVDERTLAAFHANKERASDEKAVEKLFKDINNGGLRRKRRASLELTDSEDDLEDRRRRKRAEFARMRKALLADENVGKIAEDPKKSAFLHSIEDRDGADWGDVLEEDGEEQPAVDRSQALSTQEVPESQVDAASMQQGEAATAPEQGSGAGVKRKRAQEDVREIANKRLPASMRRTRDVQRKPTTLIEMRESISFLVEDPHASTFTTPDSDAENEADEVEISGTASFATTSSVASFMRDGRGGGAVFAARRATATAVIDRVQVKRANSLNVTADADGSRLAFFDPGAAGVAASGFKVPSLLRRATADLNSGADANGISRRVPAAVATERAAGGADKGEFVRKGSGKMMSVNYQAREASRKGVVENVERRRVDNVRRVAAGRKGVLGVLGGGAWD